MAVNLDGSTQYLTNSATPITSYPFTVAMWAYPDSIAATNAAAWSVSDTAGTGNYFMIRRATDAWQLNSDASATFRTLAIATSVTANAWHFVVGRVIASANRRLSILKPDGSVVHGADTTASTPAGNDNMSIGALLNTSANTFFNGKIAEVTFWNADIQPDGIQLQDGLLRQLAYGGPWSLPHVVNNIVSYQSLRNSLSSADESNADTLVASPFGRQTWSNVGAATLGPHPPLPYGYADRRIIRPFGMM